jgi:Lrp/AsnC family transcriptional regulator, leucine-responsive regulatory protein
MAIELDDVDVQLLTALQEDADRTNVELARLAGLSPAATLHRVRRLKESGVIRIISAQLDPAAAGFPLQVYITATLARHDPRSSQAFDNQIRALPQIIAADNVAGETDYLLTAVARDVADLQTVLASLATRGGSRLVTYLRLAEVKPPSRLPLGPSAAAGRGTGAKSRRARLQYEISEHPHSLATEAWGDFMTADPTEALSALMPCAATPGIEWLRYEPEEVRARLAWAPGLCTSGGAMHGHGSAWDGGVPEAIRLIRETAAAGK